MKNLKKQNGITLIALVITIAIMIILAAVTIRVSLKGGLFGTAKEATGIKQIAQEKEQLLVSAIRSKGRDGRIDFAALDNDLPDGFSKIAEGTYESEAGNKYEVTEDGTVILLEGNGEEPDTGTDTETPTVCAHINTKIEGTVSATCTTDGHTGRTICVDCGKVLSNGNVIAALGHTTTDGTCDNCDQTISSTNVIPANATYYVGVTSNKVGDYTGATTILTAGDNFPTINDGDVYVYGDYEYRYNLTCWSSSSWQNVVKTNGWGVSVLDKTKSTYGVIIESINGKPVTSLDGTFGWCESLVVAPTIPNTVTRMEYAFMDCFKLTRATAIPYGVTDMDYAFFGCYSLAAAPSIPSSVTDLEGTFSGCSSLTTAPVIPSSVTNMKHTFEDCVSLEGTVVIHTNTGNHADAFALVVPGKNITLTGTSKNLEGFAYTSTSGSRIVYDINGNILKQ